jgi:MFS family permease
MLSGYFLIILPIECNRISETQKALFLGMFIALAGVTQLVCPVIGMASDGSTSGWGRRRPYMLLGGVGGVVFLGLQLLASAREMWELYAVSFTCAMLALNTIFSAMVGLIPDLVHDSQVGAANGLQAVLSVTGALSGFAYFIFFLKGDPEDIDPTGESGELTVDELAAPVEKNDAAAVQGMYVLYMLLVASTICLTAATTKETPAALPSGETRRRLLPALTREELKAGYWLSPVEHHDFFYVTLSRTFFYMGISAQTFFLYFLKDVVRMDDPETGVTLLSSIAQLAAAMSAYPTGMLSDSMGKGRKKFIYASCFVLAAGNFGFIFSRSLLAVCVISFLVGIGNGGYLAMDSALAIDTLPDHSQAARFLGIWGVASFLGTALGPLVGGPILYFIGSTDEPGVYSILGYAVLLMMSVAYFTIAAVVLKKVKAR